MTNHDLFTTVGTVAIMVFGTMALFCLMLLWVEYGWSPWAATRHGARRLFCLLRSGRRGRIVRRCIGEDLAQ